MRDAAFMVSWGQVVPGREKEALALFQKSQAFWQRQEASGTVKRIGTFFLAPGSGAPEEMAGFGLYVGRLDALQSVIASEEYEGMLYLAAQILNGFRHRLFLGGTEQEVMRVVGAAVSQWQAAGLMKA